MYAGAAAIPAAVGGVSAAFNVSQKDIVPLELFREALGCGSIRMAGNDGWYLEVNNLRDIRLSVVPFFRRYPMVGRKALDFELFAAAVVLLSKVTMTRRRLQKRYCDCGSCSIEVAKDATIQRESSEAIRQTPADGQGMRWSDLMGDHESW